MVETHKNAQIMSPIPRKKVVKIIQCVDNISITEGNAYSPQQNPTRTYLGRHRGTKVNTFTFPVAKRTRARLLPSLKVHHLSHAHRPSVFSLVSQEAMARWPPNNPLVHMQMFTDLRNGLLDWFTFSANLTGFGITWEMHLQVCL